MQRVPGVGNQRRAAGATFVIGPVEWSGWNVSSELDLASQSEFDTYGLSCSNCAANISAERLAAFESSGVPPEANP
jgi:hypothetical protein